MAISTDASRYIEDHFRITGPFLDKARAVLEKLLEKDLGRALIDEIVKRTNDKIKIATTRFFKPEYIYELDEIKINIKNYYIIEGVGDDKVITHDYINEEMQVFHELIHELQFAVLGEKASLELARSSPENPEYDNKIEEETIVKGFKGFSEHSFCRAYSFPVRLNHTASSFPPAIEMLDQSIDDRVLALREYFSIGAVRDMEIILKTFTDDEAIKLIESILDRKDMVYMPVKSYNSLRYLVKDRKMKLDSNKVSIYLVTITSRIKSIVDLKEFESLGFDVSSQNIFGENILFNLLPDESNYLEIIKYLVTEKHLDINQKNNIGKSFFMNKDFPKDILVELQKMGAIIFNQ